MIHTRNPFADPEFIKSRIVVPFDAALDAEARREDEREASFRFAQANESDPIAPARGIWCGLLFTFFIALAGYLVWRA
jgi:hypothetical protein